jgi:hypothetical protein
MVDFTTIFVEPSGVITSVVFEKLYVSALFVLTVNNSEIVFATVDVCNVKGLLVARRAKTLDSLGIDHELLLLVSR